MGNIFAIELGTEVKCKVTGFKGTAISRIEYDTGCRRYEVQPKAVKNKVPSSRFVDEINLIDSVPKPKKAGGYHPNPVGPSTP